MTNCVLNTKKKSTFKGACLKNTEFRATRSKDESLTDMQFLFKIIEDLYT